MTAHKINQMLSKLVFLYLLILISVITADANSEKLNYTPVVTPNGSTLPWEMVDGVKEFHLIVEEIDWVALH